MSSTRQTQALQQLFDCRAADYDRHAVLEQEVGGRLLERASHQRHEPSRIADLGSGTGYCTRALKRLHRKAEVIGIDVSAAMAAHTRRQSAFMHPLRAVCADMHQLPLAQRSLDLLFSNLALQWVDDLPALMAGFRRVLKPDGMLLFSTLGPASLGELRDAASRLPGGQWRAQLLDMHDLGDVLQAAGFSEPVMDSEFITIEYRELATLHAELQATGTGSYFADWTALASQGEALRTAFQPNLQNGCYPVSYEIVYGTAFGPAEGQPIKTREGDVAAFSVDALKRSRRGGR